MKVRGPEGRERRPTWVRQSELNNPLAEERATRVWDNNLDKIGRPAGSFSQILLNAASPVYGVKCKGRAAHRRTSQRNQ